MTLKVRANLTLPEVFDNVRMYNTHNEKVKLLKLSKSKQLAWIVNATYNYDFSAHKLPKYKKSIYPVGMSYQTINSTLSRLEGAIKQHQMGNIKKYETMMLLVLENITADEALLLESVFNNKKIDGISKSVWKQVYPHFFLDEKETKTNEEEV